ncbi:beta-lactamase-like protein [Radiomyces spectabilis]|uniref:beta-lactamase-like protein n=1 Tax=Radiomyces spectabilis TaxID=64574 RepID=UPI00221FFCE6|nr:beta-lactamase-like protein [Radiomyces spectabilis]KAI8391421.1 beta-lactamase-like protein [Radiomyces spectabilis]
MAAPMDITFLGTGSAQPSSTRNHQAMALRVNGDIWLFDCGEATQHQLQKSHLKMGRITKIFITHMHGDHCFGLAPLMCSMTDNLNPGKSTTEQPPIDVYGPSPLRKWLRSTLQSTYSRLGRSYRVHELLLDNDVCDVSTDYHENELPGENLQLIEHQYYRFGCKQGNVEYTVSAAPIRHSIPSLGYIIQEPDCPGKLDVTQLMPILKRNTEALQQQGYKNPMAILGKLQRDNKSIELPDGTMLVPPPSRPGRQIVILGDTFDASSIVPLCHEPHLLVHEATNALTSLDQMNIKSGEKAPTYEEVKHRAIEHGHSTPQMAAALAKQINARKLILTHFSARYKGDESEEGVKVMEEIRRAALNEFDNRDNDVYCARDLWSFEIKYKPEEHS